MDTPLEAFVARVFAHSESLAARADVAVEQARHLRLYTWRLRSRRTSSSMDELTDAKLRRALSAPK